MNELSTRNQVNQEEKDVLNLPPRSHRHHKKSTTKRKERKQLYMNQLFLRLLLALFILLIFAIPMTYYWLQ